MVKKLKDESGLTLLELMIAVTIMVGIMGSIFTFMQSTYKMSNSITKLNDQHNAILNINQYLRATLANATFVSLVDTDEPEYFPEAGYSYLYCGKKGGLTLLDGTTGRKSELYTVDSLDCQKIFVLFRPDKLKELDVTADYISTNPQGIYDASGNRYDTTTYNNANAAGGNSTSGGAYNGTFDAYTQPQAYGELTATIKVVAWSRDDDIKYNRLKYPSAQNPNASGAPACSKYFGYVNEIDSGYYHIRLDEALNGFQPNGATVKTRFNPGECFWGTAQEFSNEITFHNTDYIIVQHTYLDKTVTPNELHRQGCLTVSGKNDEPKSAIASYIQNLGWHGLTLADGTVAPLYIVSPGGWTNNPVARVSNNALGYSRCIKFIRPAVESGVVTAGANVDIQDFSYGEVARSSTEIAYKVTFKAVNTASEAGSKSWTFNYPVSIPAGKAITITGCNNCTATASGRTITFNSIAESSVFTESGTPGSSKDCSVDFTIERDPEPTYSNYIPEPYDASDPGHGGKFKITVSNPVSKYLGFKATLTWSDGTTFTADNTANWQWLDPNASKEIVIETGWDGADISPLMAEEPTVTFSDLTYNDNRY